MVQETAAAIRPPELRPGDTIGVFTPSYPIGHEAPEALAEFDCCHTVPMLTLPLGKTVELDADRQIVALLD